MSDMDIKSLPKAGELGKMVTRLEIAPDAYLRLGRVHEVTGSAADMFAMLSAAKCDAEIVWIGLGRDLNTLCPTGLQHQIDITRLILIEAVSRGEILWAADQAMRAEGGFTVIVDMPDALSLKESRRLQLAAEQGGGLGLVLLRGLANTSASQTRWACEPLSNPSPAWDWICQKGKNGEVGRWQIFQQRGQNAKDTLHMATAASA